MAVVLSIDWDGITPEQYDKATAALNLIADRPKGLRLHLASFDESGAHITDVWDSAEDFQAFAANRLAPTLAAAGIEGMPPLAFREARNVVSY